MPGHYLLIVLAALSAFNFLDQQFISILLEPVRHEFSLTDIQLGLLSGLAFVSPPIARWSPHRPFPSARRWDRFAVMAGRNSA